MWLSSYPDLTELVPLLVQSHHDLVHNAGLTGPQEGAAVPLGVALVGAVKLVVIFWQRYGLTDDHILTGHTNAGRNQSVVVQFVIDGVPHTCEGLH